ncbi:hypothetical protein FHS77_001086 [Paenochrobactrum gallinarii]|uniref:Glycosyl transferase n=1 Tax=Paenochrobactrum gallinarii TaxID=643673 RepID=A0A841LVI3_9HYPH|nr:DUF6492 family protein [Paenochrobactrum gallinarii]MBB6260552.1 hypothetical protein [Paenochrobactrum gallinarii]
MAKRMALVTASYDKDFDRCRLLCETLDRYVTGFETHYILVAHRDVALFKQLASPNRIIVDERDLLPRWLWSMPDPKTWGKRQIWVSPFTKPLYGWHVQQLRRIAIAEHVDVDGFLFCDSDVAFLREFSADQLWQGDDIRLLRYDQAMLNPPTPPHRNWSDNAARIMGIKEHGQHDYIANVVSWRRDAVLAMCRHIEEQNGRSWVKVLGQARDYSECILYGQYVDEIEKGRGHFHVDWSICHVYWFGPAPDQAKFDAFMRDMRPDQVAIGLQSFMNMDSSTVKRIVGL